LRGLDESLNESLDQNRRKISQLMEENSLLKKNLSFAHDSREGEEKFV
jgi:cell shape-determining protein MreC